MSLLVIDWDYFFPVPHDNASDMIHFYDWGHSEHWGPGVMSALWITRAAQFIQHDRPLPTVNDGWKGWWDRFAIDPEAHLVYANSNVNAIVGDDRGLLDPLDFDEVWLYDQHHDSGYGRTPKNLAEWERVTCEDWLIYFTAAGVDTHVRYPAWHTLWETVEPTPDVEPTTRCVDEGNDDLLPVFSQVMVCRSDAWVPPWCDQDFQAFIEACPVIESTCVDDTADEPRAWDVEDAIEHAKVWIELRNLHKAVTTGTVDVDTTDDRLAP